MSRVTSLFFRASKPFFLHTVPLFTNCTFLFSRFGKIFFKTLLTSLFFSAILLLISNINKEFAMKRRITKQRQLVLDALMRLYHPTAEEVYDLLRRENPSIGRATVFRNLSVLTEEGMVTRLHLGDDVARYDANANGHYHFLCRSCAKIIDLPQTQRLSLPKSEEFMIESQSVHFWGLCRTCLENSTKQ